MLSTMIQSPQVGLPSNVFHISWYPDAIYEIIAGILAGCFPVGNLSKGIAGFTSGVKI